MTPASSSSSAPVPPRFPASWCSVHVPVASDAEADRMLVHVIPEVLMDIHQATGMRRFYYIRHEDDDGREVRLRFHLPTTARPEAVRSQLATALATASDTAEEGDGLPEEAMTIAPYDRDVLYFGASMKSVYAELLNEQSAYLALAILAWAKEDEETRFAVLTAAWRVVLYQMFDDADARAALLQSTIQFAEHVLQQHDQPVPEPPSEEAAEAVVVALPTVGASLGDHPALRQWARLLKRALAHGHSGVVTHAAHLLFNKVGVSLEREHAAARLLRMLDG